MEQQQNIYRCMRGCSRLSLTLFTAHRAKMSKSTAKKKIWLMEFSLCNIFHSIFKFFFFLFAWTSIFTLYCPSLEKSTRHSCMLLFLILFRCKSLTHLNWFLNASHLKSWIFKSKMRSFFFYFFKKYSSSKSSQLSSPSPTYTAKS